MAHTSSTYSNGAARLIAVPGPIEVAHHVLQANASQPDNHTSQDFIYVFGDCIRMLRRLLFAPNSQPILVAGSGTLGWDQVAANLVEPGDRVLVLNSGYFADSFADCLATYGALVDQIIAPLGEAVPKHAVEDALARNTYKLVTVTHVDTSTGVLTDPRPVTEAVKRLAPQTLVVLDGVCSVASEEIRQEDWDIDVVLSATQKGLGVPPGMSVLCVSPAALRAFENRKTPVRAYYASWTRWLPIMRAYEAGKPAYFATPPVSLVKALNVALTDITQHKPSIEERFRLHEEQSTRFKEAMAHLGLVQVAKKGMQANSMSAVFYPVGLGASDILPRLLAKGVVVAGGLHKDIKDNYFRVGHMGITAVDKSRGDIDRIINAIMETIYEAKKEKGIIPNDAPDGLRV